MFNSEMNFEGLKFTITNSMPGKGLSIAINLNNRDLIDAICYGDERIKRMIEALKRIEYEYELIHNVLGLGIDHGIEYFFLKKGRDIDESLSDLRVILESRYAGDKLKEKAQDAYHQLHLRKHQQKLKAERQKRIKKRAMDGDVYLLEAVLGTHKHYKIGWAKNAKKRANLFEVKLPFDFELIHTFPADNARQAEVALHEKFKHCRTNGEWFSLSSEDVSRIQKIGKYENKEFLWNQAG